MSCLLSRTFGMCEEGQCNNRQPALLQKRSTRGSKDLNNQSEESTELLNWGCKNNWRRTYKKEKADYCDTVRNRQKCEACPTKRGTIGGGPPRCPCRWVPYFKTEVPKGGEFYVWQPKEHGKWAGGYDHRRWKQSIWNL